MWDEGKQTNCSNRNDALGWVMGRKEVNMQSLGCSCIMLMLMAVIVTSTSLLIVNLGGKNVTKS